MPAPPRRHVWLCLGCDTGESYGRALEPVRKDANTHAGTCRALPKPGSAVRAA